MFTFSDSPTKLSDAIVVLLIAASRGPHLVKLQVDVLKVGIELRHRGVLGYALD